MLLNFSQLFEKYNMNIKGVIHIGAHYGQEHGLYKSHSIQNVMYFEPLIKNYEILKQNVGEDAVLFNLALGNENKEIDMFVESSNKGMSSSILEPSVHLTQYPWIRFNEKETVQMKRLDDIEFDRESYNFINIDVQGYELEVFKGSENFLEKVDYIISEINRDELYKNCTRVDELSIFLSKYGFELVEINWEGGTWGDGLYVKNKKI
jgi:FkbM family methyltransferase